MYVQEGAIASHVIHVTYIPFSFFLGHDKFPLKIGASSKISTPEFFFCGFAFYHLPNLNLPILLYSVPCV
jgi:hypothetical protein